MNLDIFEVSGSIRNPLLYPIELQARIPGESIDSAKARFLLYQYFTVSQCSDMSYENGGEMQHKKLEKRLFIISS